MDSRRTLAPWLGGFGGPLVWWVHQRTVADGMFFNCDGLGVVGRLVWSVVLLALIALAMREALLVWRGWGPHAAEPDNRRFVALVSLGVAGVSGLAIIFGAMSSVIIPGCYR